ncbi:MAG: MBL fold metallo-hydrolase [Oscillospiraceae bacterium]|nr:MBL fold metallo-hydrolase [Oscillospiraceae bacterium]
MRLTWLGHACFTLESDGYKVVIDPYTDVPGCGALQVEADAVLCSHHHFDHGYTEAVTLRQGRENPFTVTAIDTFHDEKGGALRGENKVHILQAEGLTAVHLGDLGHRLDASAVRRLRGCDVLMIPVGGTYTLTGDQAAEVALQLQPRAVIPMHYRGDGFGFDDISTLEPFLSHFDGKQITFLRGNTLELTAQQPCGVIVPAFAE